MAKFTQAATLEAIKSSGAIMSTIARKLNCDWSTAKVYVNKWASTKAAYEHERNQIDDMAESTLLKSIKDGNTQDAKWWLARTRRDRFGDATKVTGADGEGPVKMRITIVKDND